MAIATQRSKVVVIVGPTASGKSALALKIAKNFDGEIICADSRTVYKGMDIGTAKPTKKDQNEIKHWGLDLVEPGQRFTAYQFKSYAQGAISDIQGRGKLPILVGGTGLYIDSVVFDFGFRDDADPNSRQKLEELATKELQEIILTSGYLMPRNKQNKRHLIRTIETKGRADSRKDSLPKSLILVGILPEDEVIRDRIIKRAGQIFTRGVLRETEKLVHKYGKEAVAETGGIAYKICLEVLAGNINMAEATASVESAEWQYARRQKTWFRRNPHINWFNSAAAAYDSVKSQLLNT